MIHIQNKHKNKWDGHAKHIFPRFRQTWMSLPVPHADAYTIYVTTKTTNKKTSQPTFKTRQSNGHKFFKLSCDLENGSQWPKSVRTCEAWQSIMHGFQTHLHSIWWMLTRFSLRHRNISLPMTFPWICDKVTWSIMVNVISTYMHI